MTRDELRKFMQSHSLMVEATVAPTGAPQAAVVGFVVSGDFEIFFDTLDSSRKAHNLRKNPKVACVIGWDDERTVQYEGVADEPRGAELERLKELYFARFPDGRERLKSWPGLIYVRVRPTWIRYSDFRRVPAEIVEFDMKSLKG